MSDNAAMKKKKKRLPWWAIVLIVLLAVIVVFTVVSVATIRYFTGDTLSFKGTLAMVGYGGMDLPEWLCRFILDTDRSYAGLPDVLTLANGEKAAAPETYAARREELMDLYETYMYGVVPTEGFDTAFTVVEEGSALGGTARRQQVKVTVTTGRGSAEAMLLVYLPIGEVRGVFVGENFSGNMGVCDETAVLPSIAQDPEAKRGNEWPAARIVARGYGLVTSYYGDWAEDSVDGYRNAFLRLFEEENTTAYSAWAFGIQRSVDYVRETLGDVPIASVGHSRLARVSLWAGANDPRIGLVISSCGGGLQRGGILGKLAKDGTSDHWYTERHWDYIGRDSEMPVDMNVLFALCAGENRRLCVSIGYSDLASDPVGTYDALQSAKAVWREVYGREVIPDGGYYDLPIGTPVFSESVAVQVHRGGHAMTETDWDGFMDYMDKSAS